MDSEIPQSNLIICDKCQMVPCILLNENEKSVFMKCNCGLNGTALTLEEFNTKYQISHLLNKGEIKLHSCNIHKLPLCCYCVTCNKYFCEDGECSLQHNDINNEHKVYNFYMYYNKVHTVMNTISNTFNKIIYKTNVITENIIKSLNNEITKIKQACKVYITKILLLETYLKILLINYNELPGNYQGLMNLITHSMICVPKTIADDNNISHQIEYVYRMFNTNVIGVKYEQQKAQFQKKDMLIDDVCSSTINIDTGNKIEPFTNITIINSNNNKYEITLQSINDSKLYEIANHYITTDESLNKYQYLNYGCNSNRQNEI